MTEKAATRGISYTYYEIQRIWRDCETGSQHAASNPAIGAGIYGRSLLGITEGVSSLA